MNKAIRVKVFCFFLIFAFGIPFAWARDTTSSATPFPTPNASQLALADGDNAFGMALLHQLGQSVSIDQNLVFSPYSISAALAMAWTGAQKETKTQMAQVLRFTGDPLTISKGFHYFGDELDAAGKDGGFDLSIANSLWAQNDFKFLQPFLDGLSNNFNAPPELLDFRKAAESARLQINQWVADKTDQKIKNLIAPGALDRESIMVLVNAVYFKADWLSAFKAEDTKELPFHLNSNVSAPVSMMQQQNHFRIFADNQEQVLELPYKGDQLSMVVVLPRKGQDLSALEQKLNMNVLDGWLLNMSEQIVNVKIPKFKFSFGTVELKPFLVDMGMGDAFNRGVADFSGMSKLAPGEHIYIQKVLHKAFVNVDEKGTEAAAATAVIVGAHPCCMVIPIIPKIIHLFNADHPFLFIVRDKKTNSILFIGKVADPRSES